MKSVKTFLQALLLFLFAGLLQSGVYAGQGSLASRVVIVVNERDPNSVRIGEYYAMARSIPMENIIAIDAPASETVSRDEFVEHIRNPLQKELFRTGWLLGMHSRLKDPQGRYRSIVEGHGISYLVVCRGIPLRIAHDPSLITPEMRREGREEFLTSRASVDSELALITGLPPTVSFIPNPLFQKKDPSAAELNSVLKVARLDGPEPADVISLIDSAIEGERLGLRGRAYVDLRGPHPTGNSWLKNTADLIRDLGYDLELRDSNGVFPITARFDAPALYFGWYAEHVTGPFLLEDFRFPPGAIAMHIHSFSATTLRDPSSGWVAPLIARGIAVTLGNVYEPYLELSHRPDLFLEWLHNGGNVGDAAAYAIRGFSWQGVLVGDPLYRPFKRSLDEQLRGHHETDYGPLNDYAVIRQMNLLVAEGRRPEAIRVGLDALKNQGGIALALAVAKMQVDARDRRQATRTISGVEESGPFEPMDVMLAKEAADLLSELNEHRRSLEIHEALLADGRLPSELRKSLLADGILLANRIGNRALSDRWRGELATLRTQP